MWHVTSVPPASYILQHRSRSCKCEVNYRHKLGIPSKTEVQGEAGHGSPGRLSETKGPQAELHAHFKGIIFSGNGEIGVCVWGWFPSQSSAGEGQPGEQRNQEDPTPARACHVGGAELPQPREHLPHTELRLRKIHPDSPKKALLSSPTKVMNHPTCLFF